MSTKRGGPWKRLTAICAFAGFVAVIASILAWPAYTYSFGDEVAVSYSNCETSVSRRGTRTTECDATWTVGGTEVKGVLTDDVGVAIRGSEGTITTTAWGGTARTRIPQPIYAIGLLGPWVLIAAVAVGVTSSRLAKRRHAGDDPNADPLDLADVPELPQAVLALAAERGLGTPTAGYAAAAPYGWLVTGVVLFGPLVYTLSEGIETPVEYGVAVAGVAAIGLGVVRILQRRRWLVAFFSNGLYFRRGKREFTSRWDETTAVVADVKISNGHKFHKYTLWRNATESLVLENGWPEIEEIGRRLVRDANRAMLPRYIESFDAGNDLAFGDLKMNREGIGLDNRFTPWTSVTEFALSNGALVISANGARTQLPVADLPNVPILLALARA
jgi:hypothetical protein